MNVSTINPHEKVDAVQALIETMPQTECPVVHRFAPGLYVREMTIPAGVMLVGKIHRTEHPFTISKGEITVWDEHGKTRKISAPFTGISMAGARRIGYAHEETVWTTYHATELTDPKAIEEAIIEKRDFDRESALKMIGGFQP